jgi:hypothetical protein
MRGRSIGEREEEKKKKGDEHQIHPNQLSYRDTRDEKEGHRR